jgi:predicted nucleic acid-binding protein
MGTRFVIDNSVVMAWCFKDETSAYADAALDYLKNATAVVPAIWTLEVINVLLVAERNQRINQQDSMHFIHLLSLLPIEVHESYNAALMMDILLLARSHQLSSYDACYLELAVREDIAIVTQDKKMLDAAEQIQIPVLRFD